VESRRLEGCFGLLERTVGLKVTVRCGFCGTGLPEVEEWDMDESSGVASVEVDSDAIAVKDVGGRILE
jgi:hypothetical protein